MPRRLDKATISVGPKTWIIGAWDQIGSGRNCFITIEDKSVFPTHAFIWKTETGVILQNLGPDRKISINGTEMKPFEVSTIREKAILKIGNCYAILSLRWQPNRLTRTTSTDNLSNGSPDASFVKKLKQQFLKKTTAQFAPKPQKVPKLLDKLQRKTVTLNLGKDLHSMELEKKQLLLIDSDFQMFSPQL